LPIEASPSKRYGEPSGVNLRGPASTSRNSWRPSCVCFVRSVRQRSMLSQTLCSIARCPKRPKSSVDLVRPT